MMLSPDPDSKVTPIPEWRLALAHYPVGVALNWHDVVCPEAEQCPDRKLHAVSQTLYSSGLLERFLDRLAERPTGDAH